MVRARHAPARRSSLRETLMLSRGLLESDHLPAVLAHELGHLASPDGRSPPPSIVSSLAKATNSTASRWTCTWRGTAIPIPRTSLLPGDSLIRDFFHIARFTIRLLAFASGGLGLRLTRPVMGCLLAQAGVRRRRLRRQARPSRGARRLPRNTRTPARPSHPLHLAHRAHPPARRAAHRQAQGSY